ncbi:zf-HC2 domain-containing protein [Kibdelosporangium philippinense]|uniref:Zf-HC2 domain-containing protein n=1 Tax=Kibdelosporangium philippinense TaxID=211113 RepID=A0ABS8Z230_9PSEU|nr:zf-HC2 domain-containing protein [Kibdelosporangium philippinense]MCE7002003.1 zf-HC2 domain-containing protein [Kibdelosporangium philippinense]
MTHACLYTVTVGAYLLGALCAQENDEFRRHAEVCPSCEREIAELTPTVRLLEKLKTETHPVDGHACSGLAREE